MTFLKITTCKDVYLENKNDAPKTLFKKISISFHLFLCKNCSRLKDSYKIIEEKMQKSMKEKENRINKEDVEKLKREIKSKL